MPLTSTRVPAQTFAAARAAARSAYQDYVEHQDGCPRWRYDCQSCRHYRLLHQIAVDRMNELRPAASATRMAARVSAR